MAPLTFDTILNAIKSAGPTGILIVGFWLMMTGKLVPASTIDDLKGQISDKSKEIDFWKDLYSRLFNSTRTTVDATSEVVRILSEVQKSQEKIP